ncbi:MAG: hypothetical protein ACYC03_11395, partial [Acidovorax defluvii]
MGEFAKRVQGDKIPGPLRRNFTTARWKSAFEAAPAPDDADKNLYEAALVIHQKLANIRARLKLSTSTTLTATTKLRAMVAAVNYNFLLAREQSEVEMARVGAKRAEEHPEGYWIEELTAIKLKLPGGFAWSPAEIFESLVDGIEIPIRVVLSGTPDLGGNAQMDKVEWRDITLEMNLGIFYRHAEDVWDDCLWNEYRLQQKNRAKLFVPTNMKVQEGYRMGLARRTSLNIGFRVIATRYLRKQVELGLIPRVREVASIGRHGKRQTIIVTSLDAPSRQHEEFLIARTLSAEMYYDELLAEPQTSLGGL